MANEKINLIKEIFNLLEEDEKTTEAFDRLYELEIEPLRIILTLKKYDK